MAGRGSKDKGLGQQHGARSGLGRLRKANAKQQSRIGNLERFQEDEDYLAQHEGQQRMQHTGLSLMAKFNRMSEQFSMEDNELTCYPGEVCGFEGIHTIVRNKEGKEFRCQVRRLLKKMLRGEKSLLVVGDEVIFAQTLEDDWVIERVLPRKNQLERRDSHNASLSHVFAANVDYLVIVAALQDPIIKTGLIDRYLLIAHLADVPAVIVFNKSDLAAAADYSKLYTGLGYQRFVTEAHTAQGDINALRDYLKGKSCVFAGQSGVGKSSLINACYPQFNIRVGKVSEVLHKGKHTTTASRSYLLADQTRLIDTPGIRELGVRLDSALDAALHYPDIAALHPECHYPDCSHTHEPDCAVKQAALEGRIARSRFASYLALLENDLGQDVGSARNALGITADEGSYDEDDL
jgi:ribosome biogenesis GTPase